MRATLFAGIGYLLLFGTIVAIVALWHGFVAPSPRSASEATLDLRHVDPPHAATFSRKTPSD